MAPVTVSKESDILQEFQTTVIDLEEDDRTLLRFLRARNHDLKKAEEMLRKNVKWKLDNNVCERWPIPDEIQTTFWYSYPGLDNDGRQVIYLPVGAWQTRKFIEDGWKEDLLRTSYSVMEDFIRHVEVTGFEQFYVIVDMEGSSYYKVAHYETIQLILNVFSVFEANYPERLYRAVVINAPWVFSYIFPILKPLMSKSTVDKLRVFSRQPLKWTTSLLEDMPSASIPKTLIDTQ